MAFDGLLITEIFHSLQGETSLSGLPFAFVRLTGCNLRCTYCDSAYAFKGGTRMSIDQILGAIQPYGVKHVLLTGGEPLLQRNTRALVDRLGAERYAVSIETHGEVSPEVMKGVAGRARIVMDVKTPASKMSRGGWKNNLRFLSPDDEIKFVVASREDYFWARDTIQSNTWPTPELLISPVVRSPAMPGEVEGIELRWLAERILEDRLPVRLQVQLHKLIWGPEKTGV
jgi:7-carboxy-7-deazaguanine synthase